MVGCSQEKKHYHMELSGCSDLLLLLLADGFVDLEVHVDTWVVCAKEHS